MTLPVSPTVAEARARGFAGYVAKPFCMQNLLVRVPSSGHAKNKTGHR